MTERDSPFRLLSKTRSNQILTREQYVAARNELLKILQTRGSVTEQDLHKITDKMKQRRRRLGSQRLTFWHWVIIALGLIAALVLGAVLYS